MADDLFELPHGDDFEPDTPAAAMARLRDRLRAIHPQAAAIITAHASLELEVDQILRRFVARPDKLPRLSIEHQLGVLRALLDEAWLDLVLDAISAYGALRNSVAHGDNPSEIAKIITRTREQNPKYRNAANPRYQPRHLGHGLGSRLARWCGKLSGLYKPSLIDTDTPPKVLQSSVATAIPISRCKS